MPADHFKLGNLLVADLNDTDTLGRWMGHFIASLMNEAEAATGERALELRSQCSTEILKLWKHRAGLPGDSRPMSSFEPILRALEKLDPERPTWTRLRSFRNRDEFAGPTSQLLNAAIAIDESSVRAIRALLSESAIVASDHERTWISAAPNIEGDDSLGIIFDGLDLAMDGLDLAMDEVGTQNDARAVSLKTSIRSLDEAIVAAEAARRMLIERLERSPSIDVTSSDDL
ncbi:hypothetical protein [Cryobacterium tagatosivorans]|uniref:Uncharacterized protein n=1 Tax=Cryobacterium tagatosivorans TaxID=1259199 RepID=A0A4R8UDP5_9MICO|nr:hypothetical protein [Cryobacterium tagatosivorans]TFB51056.1 hypothetical protein E3O23_08980 [Cryobacterium tagatosivorans]